jgi:hypothetical protein
MMVVRGIRLNLAPLLITSFLIIQPTMGDEVSDYLELIGIGQQQLDDLAASAAGDEPSPILLTLLMRAPSFPIAKLHEWQIRDAIWADLTGAAGESRAQFYLAAGRVERVSRIRLDDDSRQRYLFDEYYRLDCALSGEPATPAVIFSRNVPQAWLGDGPSFELDEPFTATALLLRGSSGSASDNSSDNALDEALGLATDRVHWHPDHQRQSTPVPTDFLRLARLGVDLGQFDEVKDETRVGQRDRESFYQLLAAAARNRNATDSAESAGEDRLLETLLVDPKSQRGLQYSFVGSARRAVKVIVDDVDIVMRYEVDHYYEVTMLVDPGRLIRVVKRDEDTEGKVFNNYPITFCVPQLPEGLPTGDAINEPVEITGWFLKLWTYKNEFMARGETEPGQGQPLQVAPLLIGYRVTHEPPGSVAGPVSTLTMGVVFIVTLLALCGLVYRFNRSDREFADRRRRRIERNGVEPLD